MSVRPSIDPFEHQSITIERDQGGYITRAFDSESGKEVPTREGRAIRVRGMWFSLGRGTREVIFPREIYAAPDAP